MAFPAVRIPRWLCRHLALEGLHPDDLGRDLVPINKGLSRFRSPNPEVSIVIPAFNEGAGIGKMLSSLSELQLPDQIPMELILVNDGSTDHTGDWLRALDVMTINLQKNRGISIARQAGLEAARGSMIMQADADSVYPPAWGKDFVHTLTTIPEVAMTYGGHAFLPDPRATRLALAVHEALGNVARSFRRRHRSYINVHGFNSAFRRAQAMEHGSYDHDELGSEDGEMAVRLLTLGELTYCPGVSSRVWTSPRRLLRDGGLIRGSMIRIRRELGRAGEYWTGKEIEE